MQTVHTEQFTTVSATILNNVAELLKTKISDKPVKTILIYQPIIKYREVDLSSLKTAFPDIRFDTAPQDSRGGFPSTKYDVIFVPLYGFNNDNYRLGHGAGWYDRFLRTQPKALKVGVGIEAGRIVFQPEDHDAPMDIIITELTGGLQ